MQDFRFHMPYGVRAADLNYGAHVSNSAVLNYFQDARIAYLARLGPFSEMDIGEGRGIILVEARVRYRAEMFLGDGLQIGVRVPEIGRSSFTMLYRVERDGNPTAEGQTNLVAFDYQRRKPCRVPEPLREALAAFEGDACKQKIAP